MRLSEFRDALRRAKSTVPLGYFEDDPCVTVLVNGELIDPVCVTTRRDVGQTEEVVLVIEPEVLPNKRGAKKRCRRAS